MSEEVGFVNFMDVLVELVSFFTKAGW